VPSQKSAPGIVGRQHVGEHRRAHQQQDQDAARGAEWLLAREAAESRAAGTLDRQDLGIGDDVERAHLRHHAFSYLMRGSAHA